MSFSFFPDAPSPESKPPLDASRQTTALEDAPLDSIFLLSLRYPLVLDCVSVSLPVPVVVLKKSLYTIKAIASKHISVASPNNLSILNVF